MLYTDHKFNLTNGSGRKNGRAANRFFDLQYTTFSLSIYKRKILIKPINKSDESNKTLTLEPLHGTKKYL